MPDGSEGKRFALYYEGDVDRAVLTGLKQAGALSARLEPVKKALRQGQDAALAQAGNIAFEAGMYLAICLDLDDRDPDGLARWALTSLRRYNPELVCVEHPRVRVLRAARGALAIVPVGLPRPIHRLLADWQLANATMDDYLVRLCAEIEVYSALETSEVKGMVPHGPAWDVLASVRDQLASHEYPVTHSKRLAHLVRGVSNFYASPAHFAERLLEKCVEVAGSAGLRGALEPLADDLDAAVLHLDANAR